MTPALFKQFCEIAYSAAGIRLQPGKEALVEARVARRLRRLDIATPKQYLRYIRGDETGHELSMFVDAITTNFTSFFREPTHFDFLTQWVQSEVPPGQETLRVWCAAAATGEEPYTLAITLLEALGSRRINLKILATDISTSALTRAKQGVYEEKTVAPLSPEQRNRFLRRAEPDASGEPMYQVADELKDVLIFRRLNLARPPFPLKAPIDFIFCRNVMIYFDTPVRQGFVSEAERLLRPGGCLAIGHSETLSRVRSGLTLVKPSLYRKAKK